MNAKSYEYRVYESISSLRRQKNKANSKPICFYRTAPAPAVRANADKTPAPSSAIAGTKRRCIFISSVRRRILAARPPSRFCRGATRRSTEWQSSQYPPGPYFRLPAIGGFFPGRRLSQHRPADRCDIRLAGSHPAAKPTLLFLADCPLLQSSTRRVLAGWRYARYWP